MLAGVLLASAPALLAGADPAVAHATLVGTLPAADVVIDAVPELVELRFDEAVDVVDDAVRVFGPEGDRVDLAGVEVDDGGATLRAFDGLTSTTYGQLLLAKVGGFLALVAIGWANRSRLLPLAGKTVAPLARSLRAETAVAGAVLALTAALVHQPPPARPRRGRSPPRSPPSQGPPTAPRSTSPSTRRGPAATTSTSTSSTAAAVPWRSTPWRSRPPPRACPPAGCL